MDTDKNCSMRTMSRGGFALTHVFAALLSVMMMGVLWMLLLDRTPPYERYDGQIEPSNPLPGQEVIVRWKIRANRTCEPTNRANVIRKVIDAYGVAWPLADAPSVFGREITAQNNPDEIARKMYLPVALAPGHAVYYSEACYACNPLQKLAMPVCVSSPDLQFNVGGRINPVFFRGHSIEEAGAIVR